VPVSLYTGGQKSRPEIDALTVMPTKSLPQAKAGVGIHVFADSNNNIRGWWGLRPP
jgi:hypothetical protein